MLGNKMTASRLLRMLGKKMTSSMLLLIWVKTEFRMDPFLAEIEPPRLKAIDALPSLPCHNFSISYQTKHFLKLE